MDTRYVVPLLALLLSAVLFHWLPSVTRPGLFFGVTVPQSYATSPRGRRLIRCFRAALWACTAVAIALATGWHLLGWALVLEGIGIVVAATATHRAARRDTVPAASIVEVDLARRPERLPGGAPAFLLPLAALVGIGVWAELHLRLLPTRLPVHWTLTGPPDRWITISAASVLEFLGLTGFACFLLAGFAWAVLYWSRRVAAAGAAASSERRFRRRIVRLLLICEYFILLPPLFALFGAPPIAMRVWGAALPATIIVLLVDLIRAGQGGSREAIGATLPGGDRTDDAHWKLGLFYFNRADPSLLVEKRWGIGYTLNFGNPWAWTLGALLVAVPLIFRLLRRWG